MVINTSFEDRDGNTVLGIDANDNAYLADGSGDFSRTQFENITAALGTTVEDYVNLALATGGAAWDLNQLREGGLTATSFTEAFVNIKAEEVSQQLAIDVIASDPNVELSNLTGPITGPVSGQTVSFDIELTVDEEIRGFDLLFVRPGSNRVIGSIPVVVNKIYNYNALATDADGDILTYQLLEAPTGATINAQTGEIIWDRAEPGSYNFTVQVDDGKGGTDTQTFELEVTEVENQSLGSISGTKWEDLNGDGIRDADEPGLAGVEIYLDTNNNGALDDNEPVQITADDDPNTPDIDETGQYKFTDLLPGTYTVREVIPEGFEQTAPVSGTTASGNGFADVVLEFVSGGNAPSPLIEPYGSTGGTVPPSDFNGIYSVEPVDPSVILGPPPPSPIIGSNPEVDWLALPRGSSVTVGFTDERVIDSPGDDIFIRSFDPEDSANEFADVFVSANGTDFEFLGTVNERGLVALDLATIGFTDPVVAVKVVGLDNRGSSPGFDLIGVEVLPNSIESLGFYTVELSEGEVVENIDFGNTRQENTNFSPRILSSPINAAILNVPYRYEVTATDPDGDTLLYSLLSAPEGMDIDEDGVITWIPDVIDTYTVEIQVDDGQGGIVVQSYEINVTETSTDSQAPQVNLSFSSSVLEPGETLDLQIQGFDNLGLADLDITFAGNSLALNPDLSENGIVNSASVTASTIGVFEVVATAVDTSGNVGTKKQTIRVIDPSDTEAPNIELDLTQFDPVDPVLREVTEIVGTVEDDLEFYRVEIAPVNLVDFNNLRVNDPNFRTIAEGNTGVDGVLAQIDPSLFRNDTYYIRVVAQDFSGNANVQGVVLGIDSPNKPGEFSLDFTDLSIPVTGIPIEITRTYSSLEANIESDFGFGWTLGGADPQIQESVPVSEAELRGVPALFGGSDPFYLGTRVTLTNPEGERIGFTFDPVPTPGLIGTIWKPRFIPDPGVDETLEVDDITLSLRSDGTFATYLISFPYNPSEYTLTTKNGTVYSYDQFEGLETVEDRNGNILTYTDEGITSSTGAAIEFVRDAEGRITQIIDPEGNSLVYTYDSNGDLIEVSDRTNNTTTFNYDSNIPHYLTEVIDPLGRTGVRTEYDENGQISKIFDADGNALELNYDSASSIQTVKDPFGNTITFVFDERGNVITQIDALGGQTQRTYDDNNNVLSETDPEGNTTTYTYDERSNILSETDGEGNTTTYTYNADNDLLTETDALGNITTNTYDEQGNLIQIEDAEGNITIYDYDNRGLLTVITDADGNEIEFTYNNFGYVTQLNSPDGAEYTFTYNNRGNVTSVTNDLGQTFTYTYDNEGRQTSQQDAEGNACGCSSKGVTQTEYNAAGDKVAEIDALGRRTEYVYNDRGLLIETIYPDSTPDDLDDNPRTFNEYDELDQLIAVTDELGRVTYYEYDALNRLVKTIYPDATPDNLDDNPFIETEYYKNGLVAAEIDELGNRTEFEYDKAGNLILQRDALGNETTFEYDSVGNQIAVVDANNNRTEYVYDGLGQLIEINYADGTVEKQIYNSLGYLIEVIDQAGVSTKYNYDALGRLTKVIDAYDNETQYILDTAGNILQQIDANNHIVTFEYDQLNRVENTTLPLSQVASTTYDAVGNVKTVTDYNGVVTTYEYDQRDRLISRTYSDGTPTETFTYTLTGQLATVTDNRGTTVYEYDERNRLISRTEPDGRKIEYTYDAAGNILSLMTASGVTVYTYDALNRIDTVTDADGGVTDYDYDGVGNLIQTTLANGIIENRDYDSLNRLIYLENIKGSDIISSFTYTLDAVGNRLKIEGEDGRITEYEYDLLYRLTSETITDPVNGNLTLEYVYDAVGNRLQKIDSISGITTYIYDNNDRLISETINGITTQYQYDHAGNLITTITDGETTATYQWNGKGELTAVEVTENGETGRIEFEYDYSDIRVAINVDGEETRFLIDTNQQEYAQVIEEYQADGELIKAYTYGIDLISQTDGTDRIFSHVDGLGSTRYLTDSNGNLTTEYVYDAYGNLLNQVGASDNNYLFAGEQFDEASELTYLRARYYDAETGRFISRDPFEGFNDLPVSLHDYLYANANPSNFIDPSGNVTLIEYLNIASSPVNSAIPLINAAAYCNTGENPDLPSLPSNSISLGLQLYGYDGIDPTNPFSLIARLLTVACDAFRTVSQVLNAVNNRF